MDTKLQTFLTLCRVMNYRITAEELHLTQPAVTKQIQSLEQIYNAKLFTYDGRKLSKTEKCVILEKYCESLQYNYDEIQKAMKNCDKLFIRIGATKTIGDYVINPEIIRHLSHSDNSLSLIVDNTENLLTLLDNSKIDFAVVEGFLNKRKYDYKLLRKEAFVGICSSSHRLAGQTVSIEDILNETLIIREDGSGTRDILEHELKNAGYSTDDFSRTVYISSFKIIRELVLKNTGISFVYKSVIGDDNGFSTFKIDGFNDEHEFNIVYLKNTNARKYVDMFFRM